MGAFESNPGLGFAWAVWSPFTASLLTVLQILTLTDWQHVFYDSARTRCVGKQSPQKSLVSFSFAFSFFAFPFFRKKENAPC